MANWEITGAEAFDELNKLMEKIATPGPIIDQALRSEGAKTIEERIKPLIPRSGRTWRGKAAAAASAQPFTDVYSPMAVEIVARGRYGYLYFPNDGSNTRSHAGNQQFMERGLEAATDTVIEQCVKALMDNFEGG